jgi:excisionase family DNA binding protein
VREVAADLGVTPGRVYQLIAAGVIPATRVNRTVFVPRRAWEAWLRRRSEEALAELADPTLPRTDDAATG